MPAKSAVSDNISKLEQKLTRLQAAERKKFKNEDILRLEKNGDISYERVRTVAVPRETGCDVRVPVGSREQNHSTINAQPPAAPANFLPETPVSHENGHLIGPPSADPAAHTPPDSAAEVTATAALSDGVQQAPAVTEPARGVGIIDHDAIQRGQKPAASDDNADPLEELLARALARPKRGRPAMFDDKAKGQIIALLSLGMSLRQAASVLGVSHNTIRNTLKADPALADEINAARFQAQLQPLACVIREARRSWKAATWLLKYLDAKITTHEETPDERRQRQQRETDEFFGRSPAPGVKKRRELA